MKNALFLLLFFTACAHVKPNKVEESAIKFFELYKARDDWQGFQDLYAEDMVFEDVIFQYTFNKEEFINFYNWPDSLLAKHLDYPEALVLEDLALTDSSAVGRGHFNPFYYAGVLYDDKEHARFTMWLYFDKEGKITKHIDFIEYPIEFQKMAVDQLIKQSGDTIQ